TQIVDTVVQGVLGAPIPPTVDDVATAALAAAEAAEMLVRYGPEAAAVATVLSNPLYGAPVAAAIVGVDLLLGDHGIAGAVDVRSRVIAAVEEARRDRMQLAADRWRRPIKTPDTIDLDREYPSIVPGSWLVFATPGRQELFRVGAVVEASRAEFTLTGKLSRMTLSGASLAPFATLVRETSVFGESDELQLAETPLDRPVSGLQVVLDRTVSGVQVGRRAAISGRLLRALVAADGLWLTIDATGEQIEIRRGELLTMIAAPAARPAGRQRWQLRTISGLHGSLEAPGGA
ncbi:MAG TPA: hypothetical protein PKC19_22040, partial [Roseiflexaceae bacterium]|nr:hypothetical protein [Roseiflexaceae bacterium]